MKIIWNKVTPNIYSQSRLGWKSVLRHIRSNLLNQKSFDNNDSGDIEKLHLNRNRGNRDLSVQRPHSITRLDDHQLLIKQNEHNLSGTLKLNLTRDHSTGGNGQLTKTLSIKDNKQVRIKDFDGLKQDTKKLLCKPAQDRFNRIKEK